MKLSNDVIPVLSSLEFEGVLARIQGQLDRKLYVSVDKVLQACGGKWNRSKKAHVFDSDARERIEVVLATGEVTTAREVGYFPTPSPLAEDLVELADVQPGHRCLEPSAGDGALVQAMLGAGGLVTAIERDARRRAKLAEAADVTVLACEDFMEYSSRVLFDRVVMNPPFCKVGLGDHLDHVRHAHGMLATDGVLVSVLPASVRFRQDRRHREFREWVESIVTIEDLPEDSFKASGTSVRTCVIRVVAGAASAVERGAAIHAEVEKHIRRSTANKTARKRKGAA